MTEVNNIQSTNLIKKYFDNQQTKKVENNFAVKNEPIKDTIELSKKNKNKKAILYGGLATIAAVFVGLITKKKLDAKTIQQLPEFIDFNPAKTIKEAKEFGKNHLGIKKYYGFKNDDLDIINWINEGLTICSNASKGKFKQPKRIISTKKFLQDASAGMYSNQTDFTKFLNGTLTINNNFYKNIDDLLQKDLKEFTDANLVKILDSGEIELNSLINTESVRTVIKKLQSANESKLSFNEKVGLHETIDNLSNAINMLNTSPKQVLRTLAKPEKLPELEKMLEGSTIEEQKSILFKYITPYIQKGKFAFEVKESSPFATIFHEMGHLQDIVERSPAMDKFKTEAEYPKELRTWLEDVENIQIANSISAYATTGPGEFIAETFAKILSGKKIPDKAMELYNKMNGPQF